MSQFRSSDPPHVMPCPSNIPWDSTVMGWTMVPSHSSSIMEFKAPQDVSNKRFIHHKRRAEDLEIIKSKQFITEEKMAAHLNGLHISSDYISHSASTSADSNQSSVDVNMDADFSIAMTSKDLEEKLRNANRITICEEIKKLHNEDNAIIPKALLGHIEKPCTSLVLWQPPQKLENFIIKFDDKESDEDDDNENNNNNNFDLNTMDTDMI